MKKTFGDYRQLWKRYLWEGPEHLLYIDETHFLITFSEHYKRIDYKNIQAITVVRTAAYWVYAVLLALFVAIFAIMAWNIRNDSDGLLTFFIVMLSIVGVALLVHLIKGPTCRLSIQTAVQLLHIRPVKRRQQALKIMQRLQELCEQHQTSPSVVIEAVLPYTPPVEMSPAPAVFVSETSS